MGWKCPEAAERKVAGRGTVPQPPCSSCLFTKHSAPLSLRQARRGLGSARRTAGKGCSPTGDSRTEATTSVSHLITNPSRGPEHWDYVPRVEWQEDLLRENAAVMVPREVQMGSLELKVSGHQCAVTLLEGWDGFRFYFYTCVLPLPMYLHHTHVWCSWSSEEWVRCPGTGVSDGCEPPL